MHHHYLDIRDRLGDPVWWDEHAVPRYCPFHPRSKANIYAHQVALLAVACQGCGREFHVCLSADGFATAAGRALATLIEADAIHYGDPPNTGCCPAGPTMNSVPLRVLEFWHTTGAGGWQRRPDLERAITCDWSA